MPLSVNIIPGGRPLTVRVAAGVPDTTTVKVNVPLVPTTRVAELLLAKAGAELVGSAEVNDKLPQPDRISPERNRRRKLARNRERPDGAGAAPCASEA